MHTTLNTQNTQTLQHSNSITHNNHDRDASTTKFPREVPPLPWYRQAPAQMAMAGFLPFSAIYIELYYIFASIWGHKVYTIYSILFIVFAILIVVTSFITVALTYFQLAVEDHRWWWRSFLCGGSTALFVGAYCVFYYHARSDMSGFMQGAFFFGAARGARLGGGGRGGWGGRRARPDSQRAEGATRRQLYAPSPRPSPTPPCRKGYNAVACLAFFLMLGTVGWWSAHVFVRRIFQAVKVE